MSWELVAQIGVLILLVGVTVSAVASAIIGARTEASAKRLVQLEAMARARRAGGGP